MQKTRGVAQKLFLLIFTNCLTLFAQPTASYYNHVVFDNSLTPDRHYYSSASVSEPSTLDMIERKLPVDRDVYLTPPNSIRVQRKGATGGSWEAELSVDRFRNRPLLNGDTLLFWIFAREETPLDQLPEIELRDQQYGFTGPVSMSRLVKGVPARQWVEIRAPLQAFESRSLRPFVPALLERISFVQTGGDGVERTWWIDEVQILPGDERAKPGQLLPPSDVRATGYERHIDVTWKEAPNSAAARYIVHRALDGGLFRPIGMQLPGFGRFTDYLGPGTRKAAYKVTASGFDYKESGPSAEATASPRNMTDDELLTMLQQANFRYYWDGAHPIAGMARENIPGDDNIVAVGASGFGIMAILVGAERGFVPRAEALDRLLKITAFLEKADRYHGVWPHFLDGRTGKTMPVFGKYDGGGDLVETSFLIQGLLAARQYFQNDGDPGRRLYVRISTLWRDVEWDWFRRSTNSEYLFWHWSPRYTWHIDHRLIGFNEVMITYLLAIASPTHSVPASLYYTGWASKGKAAANYRESWSGSGQGAGYGNGNKYFDITLPVGVGSGGPLFFTHYSYMGFDPHAITDTYTNYFENNRTIVRINRAYCIANPKKYPGYGEKNWGLTAADGPAGYVPHEPSEKMDTGTMVPTGALSSFPYLPEASMDAFRYFYREKGAQLWDIYGFRDAFDEKETWISQIFMGLNQAPIVVMVENYRTGLIWKLFMSNPEIAPMLERLNAETKRLRNR